MGDDGSGESVAAVAARSPCCLSLSECASSCSPPSLTLRPHARRPRAALSVSVSVPSTSRSLHTTLSSASASFSSSAPPRRFTHPTDLMRSRPSIAGHTPPPVFFRSLSALKRPCPPQSFLAAEEAEAAAPAPTMPAMAPCASVSPPIWARLSDRLSTCSASCSLTLRRCRFSAMRATVQ